MGAFLDYLWMVLPALRIDMFLQHAKPKGAPVISATAETSPMFELVGKKHGLHATARLVDNEFVVMEGSTARLNWVSTTQHGYARLRDDLEKAGILVSQGSVCVFTASYGFSSPSAAAAAAAVQGRPSNGRTDWHLPNNQMTYHDWEAAKLAQQVPDDGEA